ncbi:MAG: hypothetical protein AB1349_06920 [Elusimicrobiota bacterium]
MVGYWLVVILLAILLAMDLVTAVREFKIKKNTGAFIGRIILLIALLLVIINSLAKVIEIGIEIPFIP